jgi:hypothetical protein
MSGISCFCYSYPVLIAHINIWTFEHLTYIVEGFCRWKFRVLILYINLDLTRSRTMCPLAGIESGILVERSIDFIASWLER